MGTLSGHVLSRSREEIRKSVGRSGRQVKALARVASHHSKERTFSKVGTNSGMQIVRENVRKYYRVAVGCPSREEYVIMQYGEMATYYRGSARYHTNRLKGERAASVGRVERGSLGRQW